MDRWQEKENREFLRAGTIAAASLNPHLKQHSQALSAYDIFNIPRPPEPKASKKQLIANAERVFSIINARAKKTEKKRRASGGGK